jgi:uncharacterized membrane protein YkoI
MVRRRGSNLLIHGLFNGTTLGHDNMMKLRRSFMVTFASGLALAALAVPVAAQDQLQSDQGKARDEIRKGTQLSLREIERRILPKMQGSEYLGPAYDSTANAYRLKFIRDGRVTYVDVDAKTGTVIRRSR